MLKTIALFLIFALLSISFSKCFIYAGFTINKNYIAKSLCDNRNKPQLHCNGKCFLMKKIKQAEEKEKTTGQQLKKNNLYEALINNEITINAPLVKRIKTVFNNPKFTYPSPSNSIFEPPQA